MNETEIRERLREAVGKATYPEDLPSRMQPILKESRRDQTYPRGLGLVAALIAIAIVAVLFGPRLLAVRSQPRAVPAMSPVPITTPVAGTLPDQDLAAANLSGLATLVTPFNLTAKSGSVTVVLIGAYADGARTVLFFRTSPDAGFPMPSINDAYGFLNSSSSSSMGVPGDYVFVLDAGPRPGADGIAHLKISVSNIQPSGPGGSQTRGTWTFSPDVNVQPSQSLGLVPHRLSLGSWKVTLEVVEVTPSVIHLQALIEGASVDQLEQNFVSLLDPSGKTVRQVTESASVTVPKQQLNANTPKTTRINDQWPRPATPGAYQLQFQGNGAHATVKLDIPAYAGTGKGGNAPQPTDFPSAQESLTLNGSLAAAITTGRPSMCGAGTGQDGLVVFAFATYFQVGGVWYWVEFSNDPTVQQYKGPGTYTVPAWVYTVGPSGPGQVLYEGTVRLTVTSARPPTYSGTVDGSLTGLEVIAPQSQVTVTGTWTCTFGPNLGPG
jgi:hypothetical protein